MFSFLSFYVLTSTTILLRIKIIDGDLLLQSALAIRSRNVSVSEETPFAMNTLREVGSLASRTSSSRFMSTPTPTYTETNKLALFCAEHVFPNLLSTRKHFELEGARESAYLRQVK